MSPCLTYVVGGELPGKFHGHLAGPERRVSERVERSEGPNLLEVLNQRLFVEAWRETWARPGRDEYSVASEPTSGHELSDQLARMRSETFSAIMMIAAFGFAETICGMTEASMTRSPSVP